MELPGRTLFPDIDWDIGIQPGPPPAGVADDIIGDLADAYTVTPPDRRTGERRSGTPRRRGQS